MSRILLLIILVLWMARSAGPAPITLEPVDAVMTFLGILVLLVLLMGVWSRILARQVSGENLHRSVRRFARAMHVARVVILAWFAVGLFGLGWGEFVEKLLRPLARFPVELPGALIGTAPALLAWMGLWWAQYPADRALREQNLLIHLNEDLPIHQPPRFKEYFIANLRLQVLFTLVPVALILLVRDLACLVLWAGGWIKSSSRDGTIDQQAIEVWVTLLSLAIVFLFVPEILRHILRTKPLPPGALRNRLEALCRRSGLRYREILFWHTDYSMGNAAVMGMLPFVRYILLSDLLLETMTTEQIEAVFAHEIGHVVHRHMSWYAVFMAIIMAGLLGPGQWIEQQLGLVIAQNNLQDLLNLLTAFLGCAAFVFIFGCLSRWFERQADVYAARTMQRYDFRDTERASASGTPGAAATASTYVGPYGAQLFSSALHRVAVINNIPLEPPRPLRGSLASRVLATLDNLFEKANNWFHGSIPTRMNYLRELSSDPARTGKFDRTMAILYIGLLAALCLSGLSLIFTVM